jgi:8-oxo-dGTP pyrophosphatase MutT (NUDIX family)
MTNKPRLSATLVVARPSPQGPEVLLLQRGRSADQNDAAWVFPGGVLDAQDRECRLLCAGLDDAQASARLDLPEGGLDAYVGAIRECFEEAGLLFAVDDEGRLVETAGSAGARLLEQRAQLHRRERSFADICRQAGLRLAADRLHYIGHWVTPPGLPKRFDTRFFLALLPPGQAPASDGHETLDHAWLRPAVALAPDHTRRMLMVTRRTLELVGRCADTDALLEWARSPRKVPRVMQRRSLTAAGPLSIMPEHPAYAEVERLDPEGAVTAWSELRSGVPVKLSPRVVRVSWEGGNSYLVGDAASGWVAIDPGPADEAHFGALVAAAEGSIRVIVLTEARESAGAALLAARTGAAVRHGAADEPWAFSLGDDELRAMAVPHDARRCYLLVGERILFTGSLGDESLCSSGEADWVAPGRGFMVSRKRCG